MIPSSGTPLLIRQHRWRLARAHRYGGVVRLDVEGPPGSRTFLLPFDRAAVSNRPARFQRARPQAAFTRLAHLISGAGSHRSIESALDARIEILPHQLEPAMAILEKSRRVLVADEVGLGKTVQAALVIAELRRRTPDVRALVLAPAALCDQWTRELRDRFRIPLWPADRGTLRAAARCGRADNPWRRPGTWITSLDFLKQPHVFDGLPLMPWDLLVIDEAHEVAGDSIRHAACDELARRARRVLLLTATPHSGDELRFQRLTTLGALESAGADDALITFRRRRADVGLNSRRHVRWHLITPAAAERRVFDALCAFERAVLRASTPGSPAAVLLLAVFRKRALSTMAALSRSLERRLAWLDGPVPLDIADGPREATAAGRTGFVDAGQMPLQFETSDVLDGEELAALCGVSGLAPNAERSRLRTLLALARAAAGRSSKISRLAALLRRAGEPVVVFTEFRHSLEAIVGAAGQRPIAVLHGGQTTDTRRIELCRFLTGTAAILVATDVASQGLNLQAAARWVISFELPWNPARLEQRIGRVDRIGQHRTVHATLFVTRDEAESGVLLNLARRTMAVRRSLGGAAMADLVPPPCDAEGGHVLDLPADPSAGRADLLLCSERAVADAVLQSGRLVATASTPIVTSRRWTRVCRVMARDLLRRRSLANGRRLPYESGRPFCTYPARWPLSGAASPRSIAIVSVALISQSGFHLERRLLALGGEPDVLRARTPAFVGALRQIAATRLARRLGRVRQFCVRQAARSARIEQALADLLVTAIFPPEAQPGLFDRRATIRFDRGRRLAAEIRADAERRVQELDRSAALALATPAVEILLCPRQ
jgi:superfamily II DNA or RNA helicase